MKYREFRQKAYETERSANNQRASLRILRGLGQMSRTNILVQNLGPDRGMLREPFVAVLSNIDMDAEARMHKVLLGDSGASDEYYSLPAQLSQLPEHQARREAIPEAYWYDLSVIGATAVSAQMLPTAMERPHELIVGYGDNAQGALMADGFPVIHDKVMQAQPGYRLE